MSNKYSLYLIAIGVIFSFTACKISYKAQKISETAISSGDIVYTLPVTELIVDVEVTETYSYKGPFAAYAGKYFGNVNIENSDDITYALTKLEIFSRPIPDSDNYYSLKFGGFRNSKRIALTEDAFLVSLNATNQTDLVQEIAGKTDKQFQTKSTPDKISYAELALRSVRELTYDTTYREVFRDSVVIKEPVITQKFVYKTPEKQAQELADIIFLLRDDKNALLKGENDGGQVPDGAALEIMIRELSKIEKEYMSLFTGHKTNVTNTYQFRYTPQPGDTLVPIFRFSNILGILPNSTDNGNPVYTHFKPIELKNTDTNIENNKGFAYRMPAITTLSLIFDKQIYAVSEVEINQFGTVKFFRKKIGRNQKIDFHPSSGMIKSIR